MMKIKRFPYITALLAVLAASCQPIAQPDNESEGPEEERMKISLSCELLDPEKECKDTRSSHDAAALRKVTDANYYLFRDGVLVRQEYFADADDFSVSLPSPNDRYNVYILANVGQKSISTSTSESDMSTAIHVDYGSRSSYFSTITSNGFPMAGIVRDFSVESDTELQLKRLVHTLYVRMESSGLSTTKMEFTGLKIRQAPRDVFPFAPESKARYTMDGDAASLSTDDIGRLNAGETVTLFLLENMRGTLLPSNTSWKDKVPSKIAASQERYMSSFIEMTARAQTVTATYENNIYRAYIGTSPSDFNARRSTYFNLTNSFTNDMIVDEDWRIEGDTPTITGKLAFVDTRYTKDTAPFPNDAGDTDSRPFKEVDAFYTMKGFTCVYYIYRSDPDIKYDISMEATNSGSSDCKSYVTYRTSRVDDNFTALMINTTYPTSTGGQYLSSNPDYRTGKSVTFRIRSADGLIEDSMICRVLTEPLGVLFKYEGISESSTSNTGGRLNMYFCNPLGLKVQVNVTGTVSGYVSYKPNGTAFGSKSDSPSVTVNTGNLYLVNADGSVPGYSQSVVPSTGAASRIDNYYDQRSYGGKITSISGFHEFFKRIWNHTGWDSYTWLNGSNGYNKHAHPSGMTLKITLKFDSPNSGRLMPHSFSGDVMHLPVHFQNSELTLSTAEGSGAYYGSGTDMGFMWHHNDKEGSSDYVTYKFIKSASSPDKPYYSGSNQLPVGVTINGTDRWKTEGIGIPCGSVYSKSHFSDIGFDSYK